MSSSQNSASDNENPLINLLANVAAPIFILTKCSKQGESWYHFGPQLAMLLAVALPLAYGVWFFIKAKKANFFSVLGLVAVLATGLLALYLYNEDGTVKDSSAFLFSLKEAIIPLLLGACVLGSHWVGTPLIRMFLYQPELFDIERIEGKVEELKRQQEYRKTLFSATCIFASSFVFSAIANYFLAYFFLNGAETDETFNEAIAKLTFWGFVAIGLPMTVGLIGLLFFLRNKLAKVTGMHPGEVLLIG